MNECKVFWSPCSLWLGISTILVSYGAKPGLGSTWIESERGWPRASRAQLPLHSGSAFFSSLALQAVTGLAKKGLAWKFKEHREHLKRICVQNRKTNLSAEFGCRAQVWRPPCLPPLSLHPRAQSMRPTSPPHCSLLPKSYSLTQLWAPSRHPVMPVVPRSSQHVCHPVSFMVTPA